MWEVSAQRGRNGSRFSIMLLQVNLKIFIKKGSLSFIVLFIIPLSDYNQVLYEDNTTNRMRESEKLFGEILNCIFFKRTPFIVFFNKVDLFQQKLQIDSLKNYFPEFNGFQDFQDSLSFIKRKFLSKNKFPDRDIYNFETTATDTNLVKNIFAAISEIILNKMITDAGFE
eukprot:GFUD01114076.1.p1 GENE.GFUD01114076.1~~GFUD01114076.1.p1  ORF type:complete len:170 (-),score=34.57 GFUD01114076.1:87-596(-)